MSKKQDFRWTYVGVTGPFQVLSPEGRVVCTVQSGDDPNKMIPLVAAITRLCKKHIKKDAQ